MFAAHAPIPALGWQVFVESPRAEALAPLYASIARLALLFVAGLLLAVVAGFFLARALVRPIRALDEGARRIGAGELDRRIEVKTGDELEGLAEQFNRMGERLRESYAGLERKVELRTAELSEALEHQTAISEVLRVISESPSDVAPVFEAILDSATRLFGTPLAAIFRYDGNLVHQVAVRNWPAEAIEDARRFYPGPPDPRMMSGRVILSGRMQVEEDTFADPAYDQTAARLGLWRRMIGAPLLKDGAPVGAIVLAWPDPGATPPRQVELLKTFADQAVIAIENVRLLNETQGGARAADRERRDPQGDQPARRATSSRCSRPSPSARHACSRCTARGALRRRRRLRPAPSCRGTSGRSGCERGAYPMPLAARHRRSWRARSSSARRSTSPTCSADRGTEYRRHARDRSAGYRAPCAVPMLREGQRGRLDRRLRAAAPAVPDKRDRAAADLRRPGGDRDRERAPVQRDQGGARAADRDRRDPAGDQRLADRLSRCSTRSLDSCERLFGGDESRHLMRSTARLLHLGGFAATAPEAAGAAATFPMPLDESVDRSRAIL